MSPKIKCVAHIKHNATGVVRQYPTEESAELNPFWWEEGNGCCDCNRRLFFARVDGEKEDWGSPCSHDKYSVNLERVKDGYVYYREFL